MLINLSKLLSGDQERLTEQVTLEMDTFACALGEFPVVGKSSFPLTIKKVTKIKNPTMPANSFDNHHSG